MTQLHLYKTGMAVPMYWYIWYIREGTFGISCGKVPAFIYWKEIQHFKLSKKHLVCNRCNFSEYAENQRSSSRYIQHFSWTNFFSGCNYSLYQLSARGTLIVIYCWCMLV